MQVITNIKGLVQILPASVSCVKGKEMQKLEVLSDAFLLFDENGIVDFGTMEQWKSKAAEYAGVEETDAKGNWELHKNK